jgi:hypothetical protein
MPSEGDLPYIDSAKVAADRAEAAAKVAGEYAEMAEKGMRGPEGPQGPEGPHGPEGPQGEQGPQGDPGEKGKDGHTPEIIDGYWYIDGKNQNVRAVGEKGDAGNVNINDGTELKFFAGTKAEYDDLPDKNDVFAIITDDPTQIGLIDTINGFLNGSIPIPNIEKTYVRKDEKKVFTNKFDNETIFPGLYHEIAELPEGKSIDDIVGLSATVIYDPGNTTQRSEFRLFGAKTFSIDEAEPSKENGKSPEIKFYITDTYKGYCAYADVSLFTYLNIYSGKHNIEILFNNLTVEQPINANINSYKFFLDRLTCWFA